MALSGAAHAQDDSAVEAEALSSKGVAGEILDTAVEHCRRGERVQAMSMFEAIRTQLEPPPAILRLVQDLEATGCTQPDNRNGGVFRLQAGAGWDSNVSQGITSRSLVLGSGENTIELELDESYRPRSSAYAQASVDYSVVLPGPRLNLQAALGHRKNTSEPNFDLTTLAVSAAREFAVGDNPLRAQLEFAEVWLGGRHYQRTQGAALQWIKAGGQGAWIAAAAATRIDYLTQATQNALHTEAGLAREQRLSAALSVHAGFALQQDNATGTRPGGDRRGFQLKAGALALAYGWRFKPQLSYTSWDSEEVFAPGLLDVVRRSRLTQAALQAERPLSPRTSLIVEWRSRWARDTVALYRYKAHSITATLAHRF
jgi:hypothetical protein